MRNRRWNNYNQHSSNFRLTRDSRVHDDEFDNDDVDAEDMEIRFMQRCVDDILNDDIDEYKLERFNRHLKLFFKNKTFYKVTSAKKLKNLINACTKYLGPDCDLNWIDVSKMKSMQQVFYQTKFNGDISKWDVSHVENMKDMFFDSEFNGDISGWNVGKVTNMFQMFCYSNFNRDISDWDVHSVTNMESMFLYSKFNSDISGWDVSGVMNMWHMFVFSPFDSDISNWEINPDANITATFAQCPIREEFKPKSLQQLSEAVSNFNLRKGATVRDDEFDNNDICKEANDRTRHLRRIHFNRDHFNEISEFFYGCGLYLDDKGRLSTEKSVKLIEDCKYIDDDGMLMIEFGNVEGDFCCPSRDNVTLTSLEGCPEIVGGNFNCRLATLESLVGCPMQVGGYYYCGSADKAEVLANCDMVKGEDHVITEQQTAQLLNELLK